MRKVKSFLKKTFENIFFGTLTLSVLITYPWYKKATREADEAERNGYSYEKT